MEGLEKTYIIQLSSVISPRAEKTRKIGMLFPTDGVLIYEK